MMRTADQMVTACALAVGLFCLGSPSVANAATKGKLTRRLEKEHDRLMQRYAKLVRKRARLMNVLDTARYSKAVLEKDLEHYKKAYEKLNSAVQIMNFFVVARESQYPYLPNRRGRLHPAGSTAWLHLRFNRRHVRAKTRYSVRFDLLDPVTATRTVGTFGPTTRTVAGEEEKLPLRLGRFRVAAGRYRLKAVVRIDGQTLKKEITVTIAQRFRRFRRNIRPFPIYPYPHRPSGGNTAIPPSNPLPGARPK